MQKTWAMLYKSKVQGKHTKTCCIQSKLAAKLCQTEYQTAVTKLSCKTSQDALLNMLYKHKLSKLSMANPN